MATQLPSLFGTQMEPEQMAEARALQFAQMSPQQQMQYNIYRNVNRLGRGAASLLGADVQDPAMRKASQIRQLASQFDTNTPEGLMEFASALRQIDPQLAMQAAQQAQAMAFQAERIETQKAQTGQARATEAKTLLGVQREENLRQALSQLPSDASDKDIETAVRKFGDPDKIFASLERRQKAEADRQAKTELEREKLEAREREKERDREFKQQIAAASAGTRSALTDVQRELAQARLDDIKAKQEDKAEKKALGQQAALTHATKVIGDVADASSLVSGMTTGLAGKAQSFVPGTDAFNLNQRLLTIKANLGFDRLQQMRDASPTGGALGQVAVQELNALQATVGSLELGQDRKELSKNLNKIEHHYSNWIRTTRGEQPISFEEFMKSKEPPKAAPMQAPAAGTGQWSIRQR
jgi:hypothetical protein